MRILEEAMRTNSIAEIEEEIKQRQALRTKLVGLLYPSILTDEIYILNGKLWDIKQRQLQPQGSIGNIHEGV
ncbi:MAG: hypothetical protein AAB649_07645 [Patescibacteria group bacterium]